MAELLAQRIPSLERLRFCSSGTEAVLGALRAARAFTERPMIAKFEGAYHGIDDPALISYLPPVGPALGAGRSGRGRSRLPPDSPRGPPRTCSCCRSTTARRVPR